MEKIRYIFVIEAEPDFNILTRILTRLARNRIEVKEMHTQARENMHSFTIALSETKENAMKLSKKIDKEIDVLSIKVFEQLD